MPWGPAGADGRDGDRTTRSVPAPLAPQTNLDEVEATACSWVSSVGGTQPPCLRAPCCSARGCCRTEPAALPPVLCWALGSCRNTVSHGGTWWLDGLGQCRGHPRWWGRAEASP